MAGKLTVMDQMLMYRPGAGMPSGANDMMSKMVELIKNKFPEPMMAVWVCTERCNLKCRYCHLVDGEPVEGVKELSTEKAKQLINEVADAGVKVFMFSGGEALLREDIIDLVKCGNERGMEMYLSTNGTLMGNGILKGLKEVELKGLYVCLDASTKETYKNIKGVDCFDTIIESVKEANQLGIEICMTMAVTKENEHEISSFVDLCIALGVKAVYFWDPIAPEEYCSQVFSLKERESFRKSLYYRSKDVKDKIALIGKPCSGQWMRVLLEESKKGEDVMENMRFKMMAKMSGGCLSARYQCGISPMGELLPCGATVGKGCGNILEEGLINLWRNSEVMQKIRNREINGKCGQCKYKDVCGGCRVTAWLNTGDYLSSDPTCVYANEGKGEENREGLYISM